MRLIYIKHHSFIFPLNSLLSSFIFSNKIYFLYIEYFFKRNILKIFNNKILEFCLYDLKTFSMNYKYLIVINVS